MIRITILICLCMTITLSHAQSNLVIQRLSTEPRLDGDPFEPAWTKVDVHSMTMLNPVSCSMPSQQTDVKFCFTDKYLYIAGYMYDNEPNLPFSNQRTILLKYTHTFRIR